ncbi:hypothetical protein V8D89_003672, partial [Ganoderma adspersum]
VIRSFDNSRLHFHLLPPHLPWITCTDKRQDTSSQHRTLAVDGLFSPSYDGRGVIAASERAIHKQSSMLTVALAVNIVIGDAIVWWRACVIWQHKVVNCIGLLLVTITISVQRTQLTFLIGGNAFAVVSAFISLFTNVLATFLIGYKAWEHKQLMKQHFAAGGTTSRILKALALLVESGCIYCSLLIFGIIYMIHPTTSEAGVGLMFTTVAGDVAYGCFVPLVAIYPTIIIVLVAIKRSPIDTAGLSQLEACQANHDDGLGMAERGLTSCVFTIFRVCERVPILLAEKIGQRCRWSNEETGDSFGVPNSSHHDMSSDFSITVYSTYSSSDLVSQ